MYVFFASRFSRGTQQKVIIYIYTAANLHIFHSVVKNHTRAYDRLCRLTLSSHDCFSLQRPVSLFVGTQQQRL